MVANKLPPTPRPKSTTKTDRDPPNPNPFNPRQPNAPSPANRRKYENPVIGVTKVHGTSALSFTP